MTQACAAWVGGGVGPGHTAARIGLHSGALSASLEQSASDAELARRVMTTPAGRARAAEAELCRRFAPRIRLYGMRHLGDTAAADDLVQRVLEVTIEKLRSGAVREPDRVASFVLGVARMASQASYRRRRREVPVDVEHADARGDEGLAAVLVTDPPPAPEPLATERLARCLEELGQRERTIVLLSFFEERSAADIAATLTLRAGNVRVIRHRAVERLRRCMGLEEEGA